METGKIKTRVKSLVNGMYKIWNKTEKIQGERVTVGLERIIEEKGKHFQKIGLSMKSTVIDGHYEKAFKKELFKNIREHHRELTPKGWITSSGGEGDPDKFWRIPDC